MFRKLMLAAVAASTAALSGAAAQTVDKYALYSQSGFDIDSVYAFARSLGLEGEIRTTSEGKRYALFVSQFGVKFSAYPDFCTEQGCLGLVFSAFFPGAAAQASLADLNEFNRVRPHGNAAHLAGSSDIVVQRVVTNIAGITNGALAAEFGVAVGYSNAFVQFMNARRGMAAAPAETDEKPLLRAAYAPAPELDGLAPLALTADEVFADLSANVGREAAYFLPGME
ncbi:MAG TPA: YbjN domain-containing protein [Parvularculaceae bacterium]|nr:YbjN domain-containing protein [Parvularculaceae bacterium]